jgi:hypothetical protein
LKGLIWNFEGEFKKEREEKEKNDVDRESRFSNAVMEGGV